MEIFYETTFPLKEVRLCEKKLRTTQNLSTSSLVTLCDDQTSHREGRSFVAMVSDGSLWAGGPVAAVLRGVQGFYPLANPGLGLWLGACRAYGVYIPLASSLAGDGLSTHFSCW